MERDSALLLNLAAAVAAWRTMCGGELLELILITIAESIRYIVVPIRMTRETNTMSTLFLPVRRVRSKHSTPGNAWSPEDVQQLRELAAAGGSLETIAVKLRRTHSAIRNKAGMHGISLKYRRGSLQNKPASCELRIANQR